MDPPYPTSQKMAEGLHVSFSFIACRSRTVAEPWLLRVFACTPEKTVVDLGAAEPVTLEHPWVVQARLAHARQRGMRAHIRRWQRAAGDAGMTVRLDDLMDGWVRLRLQVGPRKTLVVLLGHASSRVEHVLWLDGGAAPEEWEATELATVLVQRATELATLAA